MTKIKVPLEAVFFNFGVPWIGIASLTLLAASFILGTGDAGTVRAAAMIGMLIYVGCRLAKFANEKGHDKQNEDL